MNVIISVEQRFRRTPDGFVWTDIAFSYGFWQRYLEVFGGVVVLARVEDVPASPESWIRADGPNVAFTPIPYYVGPWHYARRVLQVHSTIRRLRCENSAVIMRVPSFLAAPLARKLDATGQPYAVEVVGDPFEVFAPGVISHPLRPYFRWSLTSRLRQQCRCACAAAYVTASTLQRRYPPGAYSVGISDVHLPPEALVIGDPLTTHFSSVDLQGDAYAKESRRQRFGNGVRLLTVGSLEQPYKGVQVLVVALAACLRDGLDASLTVAGDGKWRPVVERQAADLGLSDRVVFLGKVPAGAAVRHLMDRADLFVLASLSEGLPRAMIEAMARALPCIGTNIGGIPELLPPEDRVPPGDAGALAAKIREVVCQPGRLAQMSANNLVRAREYHEPVLRERRITFYRHLRMASEKWMHGRAGEAFARAEGALIG